MAETHGTPSGYRRGCRCAQCKEANMLYRRKFKGRPPRIHGRASSYTNYGCRCEACKAAWRERGRLPHVMEYKRAWGRANYARKKAEKVAGGIEAALEKLK